MTPRDPSSAPHTPSAEQWLRMEATPVRRTLLLSIGFSLASAFLLVLQARLLASVCHGVVISGIGLSPLLPQVGGIAGAGLLRSILSFLAETRATAAASAVKHDIRTRLYRRLLTVCGPQPDEDPAALTETVTAGVEGIEPYIAKYLPHVATAGFLPIAVLMFVFPFEWRSGLLMLFSAPFIPLFMVLIGRGAEKLNREQWERLRRMAGHLLDLVQGLPDLKIFGAVREKAAAVERISDDYRRGTMSVLRVAFLSALALEFFATVSTAVVAVLVGFRLLEAKLTLADGLFVLLLAPEFYLPLRALGLHYHARMQGVAAAESIMRLLTASSHDERTGGGPVPDGPLTIRMENVSHEYAGGRGGVREITLHIPSEGMVALAGGSGTGKSTVVRLLLGFLTPTSGAVTVNGTDLARLDLNSWRRRLAWVPQHPFFFAASVRENLLVAAPEASDEEIWQALESAGARGFVSRLPRGLDTVLGDAGAGLSGGEQRRLALARACLKDAAIVILDEPTAGLDAANERLVGESLERLAASRSIVVVSHREETLARASRVYVLPGGT